MSPQIEAFEFERYRGFRAAQRALLSRLTLVYGENNAGKSAFLRVAPLLAGSRKLGRQGLHPDPVFRDGGFLAVKWRGTLEPEEDKDLVLGVTLADGTSWRWTFEWMDGRSTAVIRSLEVTNGDLSETVTLAPLGSQGHNEIEYTTSAGTQRVVFDGLIPRDPIGRISNHLRGELSAALDGVMWLGALREGPPRGGSPRGAQGSIAGTGAGAAAFVLADRALRLDVSSWFLDNTKYHVEVESLGPELERLVLRPMSPGHDIPFADAGQGLQQVFPVVAALGHLRRHGGLLALEEPESHLHPRLQEALAERMVRVLVEQPLAQIALETHSEVFLLAALNAATEPLSGRVGVLWAEIDEAGVSTLESIPLDPLGRPTTPRLEQAFSTMGVMRRRLLASRKAHGG